MTLPADNMKSSVMTQISEAFRTEMIHIIRQNANVGT